MFPASPFVRQQRSRRRRPDIDSMPRYMHYDASEHLKSPMQSVVALYMLLHTRLLQWLSLKRYCSHWADIHSREYIMYS